MKKFFLVPGLLLSFLSVFAQSSMVPGYIVTSKGDTLRGYILDRNNKWSVSSISFATSAGGSTQVYRLGAITTMYLQPYEALYHSRVVQVDMKPVELALLEQDAQRKMVTDTVLLELITRGKLNLYNYLDEKGKRHFFAQKNAEKTEELPYVKYLTNTRRIIEMPFFQGVLQGLTSDCSTMPPPPSSYEAKSLSRFVNKYNECTGTAVTTSKKKKSRTLIPFVLAGAAIGHGSYDGNEVNTFSPSTASNGKYSTTTGVLIGAGVDLKSGRESNRFMFGAQLIYQQTGETKKEIVSSNVVYKMNFTMLHLNPTIKYFLTTGKTVDPYIKVGFSGAYLLKAEGLRTAAASTREFADYSSIAYGYSGGIGARWKKLSIEGRLQGCTLPQNQNAKTDFTSFDVIAFFHFSR